jgi:hypothetical protein
MPRREGGREATASAGGLLGGDRLYVVLLPDLERNGRFLWDAIQVAQVRSEEVTGEL